MAAQRLVDVQKGSGYNRAPPMRIDHETVSHLLNNGASVRLDASHFIADHLRHFAFVAGQSGGKLTLTNLAHLDTRTLQNLVFTGKASIAFEFI